MNLQTFFKCDGPYSLQNSKGCDGFPKFRKKVGISTKLLAVVRAQCILLQISIMTAQTLQSHAIIKNRTMRSNNVIFR